MQRPASRALALMGALARSRARRATRRGRHAASPRASPPPPGFPRWAACRECHRCRLVSVASGTIPSSASVPRPPSPCRRFPGGLLLPPPGPRRALLPRKLRALPRSSVAAGPGPGRFARSARAIERLHTGCSVGAGVGAAHMAARTAAAGHRGVERRAGSHSSPVAEAMWRIAPGHRKIPR